MGSGSIESELLALEHRYWRSMKDRDGATATGLTDFPCIVSGASGVASVDEETYLRLLAGGDWTINEFALGDGVVVRQLTDDVAIIAYRIRESLTVDGEAVTLEAADASVWVRRDGRWRCAMHTETPTGDPYGRDRKAAG
ncbi:MAG TPA: nuclear transport factor 2 family protein [Caulobacter sp.]|nr:nuclear transport factor 2 family protein [Caulobacter sp.]